MEVIKHIKNKAFIQGGSFRLDKGPTPTELASFKHALDLHLASKTNTQLGCMVNDFGIAPCKRPKTTGNFTFPPDYILMLQKAQIPVEDVLIFYETTLRNRAHADNASSMKIHEISGHRIPTCTSIMGRFYTELANAGYEQQIGFYSKEPKLSIPGEVPDKSCSAGPVYGTRDASGYKLRLEVINYWVYQSGLVTVACIQKP
jgi:hypothetical protein